MTSYEHKLKNAYLGGPETHLVYDFQNDGQLGFTWTGSGNTGYESGKGVYRQNNNATNFILKNTNIYNDKKLLGVKFNVYFSGNKIAVGLCNSNSGSSGLYTRYKQDPTGVVTTTNGIGLYNNNIRYALDETIGNYTGEIEIVMNFESGKEYGTINGDPFTLTSSYADQFVTAWDNHTLHIMTDTWGDSLRSYIRRVEFITE